MNKLLILISIVLIFQSCKTESIQPEDILIGTEYYPVTVGQVSEFQVMEIEYKPNSIDTIYFKLKEEVSEKVSDNGSTKEYNIKRYRSEEGKEYVQDSLWAVRVSNKEIVKIENNNWLKVLSFPITTDDAWDLNIYLNKPKDEISYSNLNEAFNGYASTIRTFHAVNNNIINKNERYSVYAENVGLVYQYYNVTSQQPNQAKSGFFRTFTRIK